MTCYEKLRICLILDKLPSDQNSHPPFHDLTEKCIASGHHVTLLSLHQDDFECLSKCYRNRQKDMHLASLGDSGPLISSLLPAVYSYLVMQWMLKKGGEFDIVLFPLTSGIAYYTLLAKHQGWAFQQTLFCLDCHSSTLWNKHLHKQWIDQIADLAVDFLEKESVCLADHLISHDNEWLDEVKKEGWRVPEQIVFFSKEEEQNSYLTLFQQIRLN